MYKRKRGEDSKSFPVELKYIRSLSLEVILSKIDLIRLDRNQVLRDISIITQYYFKVRNWDASVDDMVQYVLMSIDKIPAYSHRYGGKDFARGKIQKLMDFIFDIFMLFPNESIKARNISTTLHRVGKMACYISREFATEISVKACKISEQLSKLQANSQSCANAIWGLAKLAEVGLLNLPIDVAIALATSLSQQKNVRPQEYANVIWGLGKLAEMGQLTQSANVAIGLADRLLNLHSQANSQEYANTIWGLGKLAEMGQLTQSANVAIGLADRLLNLHSQTNSQDYANAILGLGKLAKAGRLTGLTNVAIRLMEKLLNLRLQASSQRYANVFWGLGKLAEAGYLTNPANVAIELAKQLLSSSIQASSQDYACVIWGLGKLAEAGHLTNSANVAIELAKELLNSSIQADSQGYANVVWGLGKLAEAGQLTNSANVAIELAKQLLNSGIQASSQDYACVIWGLGKLAQLGGLPYPANITITLAEQLLSSNIPAKAQDYANAIWGLGELAESERLTQTSNVAIDLARQLNKRGQGSSQHYANAVWGLSKLAESGRLTCSADVAIELAIKLNGQNKTSLQEYANVIWGLGILAVKQALCFDEVKEIMLSLYERIKEANFLLDEAITLRQISNGFGVIGLSIPAEIVGKLEQNPPKSSPIHLTISKALKKQYPSLKIETLINGFFVDMFIPSLNLIVEIDGPIHQTVKKHTKDQIRDEGLKKQGVKILRINLEKESHDINTIVNGIIEKIHYKSLAVQSEEQEKNNQWTKRPDKVLYSASYFSPPWQSTKVISQASISDGSKINFREGLDLQNTNKIK